MRSRVCSIGRTASMCRCMCRWRARPSRARGSMTHAIPLTRLDNSDPDLFAELIETVERTARRAAFTLGDEVGMFEDEFAAYCGTTEAVGLSSGTESLVLALRAIGVGP